MTAPTRRCDCHVCRPEPSYDVHDRRTIEGVARHGWQVVLVSADGPCEHHGDASDPCTDTGDGPAFAYTVGLGHHCGHPELLISGLDPLLMHQVLNGVAQRVADGRRLSPGDVVEGALAHVPVVVEQVSETGLNEVVTWSGWFHRRRPEALALVWPTPSGIFAWQPGAPRADLDDRQPRAWREPVRRRAGVAVDPDWVFPVPPDGTVFSCTHVVDEGVPVLWAARQSDPDRGDDWSAHCGAAGHRTSEIRTVHLAHLVRSAPSLRDLADLAPDEEAWRDTPDCAWERAAIA